MGQEKAIMKQVRMLYFSGTGNTHWVIRRMCDGFEKQEIDCRVLSADELLARCGCQPGAEPDRGKMRTELTDFLKEMDLLILGFPTYGSDMPRPLKDLLPLIPDGDKTPLAVVSTVYKVGGDAVHTPVRELERRGYNIVYSGYVIMPNNFKIPQFKFFDIKNGPELDGYYESAGKTVDMIIEKITDGGKYLEGRSIGDYLVGASQRMGERVMTGWFVGKLFAHASCTRCGLCGDTCPMGNISFEKGYPEFGNDCCLCTRCYNFCPVNAINITDGTLDQAKYTRFKGFDQWKPPRLRKVKASHKKESTDNIEVNNDNP